MGLLVKLAWRNLWRNSRRSIITIAAIVFAVMLSIAQRGLQLGTYEVTINTVVRLLSGYLQVQKTGYQKNPTLRKSIIYSPDIQKTLQKTPHVTHYAPRIYADALLSFKDNSQGAFIIGIDPSSETLISDFHKKIYTGRFLKASDSIQIVVGYKLLQNLNLEIGDSVVVLAQAFDGFLGNMFCKVVGTIKTGSTDLDAMTVFMHLATAQELLAMQNRVSIIAISLDQLRAIPKTQADLKSQFQNRNLTVLSWDEISPDVKQSIELDNIGGIIFLIILIIVVAFGILNTLLMSVTERFREFGVMLSLGMPPGRLLIVVLLELIFVILIGTFVGNILGAGINYYIMLHPIRLGGDYAALYIEYGFEPLIASTMQARIFINSTLSILLICLLASIFPLWKLYRLEPLKGIRYT